jgi:hypothetical protein
MLCEWLEYIFCDGKYESINSSSDDNEVSGFIISNQMILIRLVAFLVTTFTRANKIFEFAYLLQVERLRSWTANRWLRNCKNERPWGEILTYWALSCTQVNNMTQHAKDKLKVILSGLWKRMGDPRVGNRRQHFHSLTVISGWVD